MGTWTTPNASSYMSIGGITFNIGDAMNAGYNPFQENIPYGVLTALGRMNRARGPFGSGNPLAIGTAGEDTYIDNSFAQQTDANVATCEAQGKDFDPVNQICVPRDAGGASVGGAGYTSASIPTNTLNLTGTNIQNQVNQGIIEQVKNVIEEAGGRVVEGTADLGNLIIQAVTLGQGPKLEAVIPNIFDLVTGNVGGTLVFGGGQNPVPVVGTGQTGVGAGTNVGLNVPIIGPIIQGAINVYKQGGTLADVIASIPGTLVNNPAEVLAGAAAAGLLFDEKDKDTLVSLGVDPAIIKTPNSNVGGAGTDTIAGGADTVKAVDITGNTTLKSAPLNTGDLASDPIKTGGVGNLALNTGDLASDPIKTGGVGNLALTTGDTASDPIKTGGVGNLSLNTGDTASDIIKTGGNLPPLSPAELDEILIKTGSLPAVEGGYDNPQIVKTGEEVKTSTPPAGAAAGAAGVGNLPAGGGGIAEIAGEPGELVDIDYLFDVGGDSIFAPEILEEDEDELLYPYSGGGAVKRFNTGGVSNVDKLKSVTMGQASGFGPDPAEEKNIFQKGLPALIGAGLGAAFGLIDEDDPNPSGYQGGIPEYKYNRSIVPGIFDPSDRRPGSAGRSYFTQGTYNPIMETFTQDGEEITRQRTLGGAQRRADEAAMAAQATEEEDYIAQIGQDFLDLQPVDTTEGLEFTGTITEDFINKYPNAGTGVVDTGAGVAGTDAGVAGTGAGVIDTGAGAGVIDTGAGAGVIDTGAGAGVIDTGGAAVDTGGAAVDTGAGVAGTGADPVTDLQKFITFLTPFFNKPKGLTNEDFLALGNSEYSVSQLAAALDVDGQVLSNAIENAKKLSGAFNTDAVDYLTNTSAEGADTGAAAVDTGAAVAGTGADVTTQVKPTDLQKFVTFVKGFSNKDDLTNEDLLALGNSEYSANQLATALGIKVSDLTTAIANAKFLSSAFNATDGSSASSVDTPNIDDTLIQVSNPNILVQEEINDLVARINAGNLTVADVAAKYGLTEEQVQNEVDRINLSNINAVDDAGLEYLLSEINAGNLTVGEVAIRYGLTEKEVQDAVNALNAQVVTGVVLDNAGTDTIGVNVDDSFVNTDFADFNIFGSGGAGNEGLERPFASGGMTSNQGYYLGGTTDGMADEVPATIGGNQPAALSDGEFVIPADVVSHLGNGNSDAGATQLYSMMDRVRKKRTGTTKQGTEINPMQQLPA